MFLVESGINQSSFILRMHEIFCSLTKGDNTLISSFRYEFNDFFHQIPSTPSECMNAIFDKLTTLTSYEENRTDQCFVDKILRAVMKVSIVCPTCSTDSSSVVKKSRHHVHRMLPEIMGFQMAKSIYDSIPSVKCKCKENLEDSSFSFIQSPYLFVSILPSEERTLESAPTEVTSFHFGDNVNYEYHLIAAIYRSNSNEWNTLRRYQQSWYSIGGTIANPISKNQLTRLIDKCELLLYQKGAVFQPMQHDQVTKFCGEDVSSVVEYSPLWFMCTMYSNLPSETWWSDEMISGVFELLQEACPETSFLFPGWERDLKDKELHHVHKMLFKGNKTQSFAVVLENRHFTCFCFSQTEDGDDFECCFFDSLRSKNTRTYINLENLLYPRKIHDLKVQPKQPDSNSCAFFVLYFMFHALYRQKRSTELKGLLSHCDDAGIILSLYSTQQDVDKEKSKFLKHLLRCSLSKENPIFSVY